MKFAVYPGSFNPWHEGHQDVLDKALKVFDYVIVAQGVNPEKSKGQPLPKFDNPRVLSEVFTGKLSDYIKNYNITLTKHPILAIVKGIRNANDFEYEKTQLYWNEDLGISTPTFFVITNRNLVHISSSAIRTVRKMR